MIIFVTGMLTPNFNPFPVLSTERLMLRSMTPGDAEALFQLRSDPQVMKYLDRPLAKNVGEAREFINRVADGLSGNTAITWAISLKEEPGLVGTIGYWKIDAANYRAEIGYLLRADLHGKGLMQEAMEVVIRFGFDILLLHSIEANINPGNDASIRLLERNHFIKEAHFRENYYYDGKFLDSVIYSRLTDR